MAKNSNGCFQEEQEKLCSSLKRLYLNYGDKINSSVSRNKFDDCTYVPGLQAFIKELELQKDAHEGMIHQENNKLMVKMKDYMCDHGFVMHDHEDFSDLFQFTKKIIVELEKLKNTKADVNCSASLWKMDRFEKYIKTLNIRFTKPFLPASVYDSARGVDPIEDFNIIQQRYLELASIYLETSTFSNPEHQERGSFLEDLVKFKFSESTTRLFIDALINPILKRNGMKAQLEDKLYNGQKEFRFLPNCIVDYIIHSRDGDILGVIETKAGGCLKSESVIQCILQLLVLSTKCQRPGPLFGVVTDAVHYIFIVLKDGTLEFEEDFEATHRVCGWKDLNKVACIFNSLLDLHTQ